ncbi:hypothetical protein F4776DRAFT_456480 [Hypoxylon sp. NC0597]|nr:hypothetical protein F4776DRAFT_456480 [Hypoxylon sp. NC0597]
MNFHLLLTCRYRPSQFRCQIYVVINLKFKARQFYTINNPYHSILDTPTITMDQTIHWDFKSCKLASAKSLIKNHAHLWFGTGLISPRDHRLISCDDAAFADFGKSGYLSSVNHLKQGERAMIQTCWTCENDIACKTMVAQAGGEIRGFSHLIPSLPGNWLYMKVDVSLTVSAVYSSELNVFWGILATRPTKIRIFEGPSEICPIHTRDVMIMYDCTPSTDNFLKQS